MHFSAAQRRRAAAAAGAAAPAAAAAAAGSSRRGSSCRSWSRASPPCLQDVVTIIFGQQTIQNGDEFGRLRQAGCRSATGCRIMLSNRGRASCRCRPASQLMMCPRSSARRERRAPAEAPEGGRVRHGRRGRARRLPGRVVLDAKLDTARGATGRRGQGAPPPAFGRRVALGTVARRGRRRGPLPRAPGGRRGRARRAARRVLEVLGWLRQLDVSSPSRGPSRASLGTRSSERPRRPGADPAAVGGRRVQGDGRGGLRGGREEGARERGAVLRAVAERGRRGRL